MSKVLVVDDEPQLRRLLRIALTQAGYEVEEAIHGGHALEQLRAEGAAFDLLVLDLKMPVLGGRQTLEIVSQEMPKLAVLMMNGGSFYSPPLPGVACLSKPFTLGSLLEQVAFLLEQEDR